MTNWMNPTKTSRVGIDRRTCGANIIASGSIKEPRTKTTSINQRAQFRPAPIFTAHRAINATVMRFETTALPGILNGRRPTYAAVVKTAAIAADSHSRRSEAVTRLGRLEL